MNHVFISYCHEDAAASYRVDLVKSVLEKFGITVWIDRRSIDGGKQWRDSIYDGITNAKVFIACVSSKYFADPTSYIRNELDIAFRELPSKGDEPWLIPVKIEEFQRDSVPMKYRDRLTDLHTIDLVNGGDEAYFDLLNIILPIVKPDIHWFFVLQRTLSEHVTSQIEHFTMAGTPRFKQIEDAWMSLSGDAIVKPLATLFVQVLEKAKLTGVAQTERLVLHKRTVLITYVPYLNPVQFKQSLPRNGDDLENQYLQYVLDNLRDFRVCDGWQETDFVHILYFYDGKEWILDLLYLINFNLQMIIFGFYAEKHKEIIGQGRKVPITFEEKYPTYLTNALEFSDFSRRLRSEEVEADGRSAT